MQYRDDRDCFVCVFYSQRNCRAIHDRSYYRLSDEQRALAVLLIVREDRMGGDEGGGG